MSTMNHDTRAGQAAEQCQLRTLAVRLAADPTAGLYEVGDVKRLADAWLAEHDPTPLAADHLRRWGLSVRFGFGYPLTDKLSVWDSRKGHGIYFHNGEGDGFLADDGKGPVCILRLLTVGEFLTAARLLGIDLKGVEGGK